MSEKFTKLERDETTDSVKDLVNVDINGRAHVPTDSGKRSGNFLSDHELEQIAAHADQIHEGYSARESENMLENAVGVLEDPKDIRDSLYMNGFLDDDENSEWTDQEVMDFVADARKEVGGEAVVENVDDMPFNENDQAVLNSELENEDEDYIPKHRAETSDENTPIADQLATEFGINLSEAQENESQEEFEKRQPGRHAVSTGADSLQIIDETEDSVALSADDLEEIPTGAEITPTVSRSRFKRALGSLRPAGFLSEASAWAYTRGERKSKNSRFGKIALGLGGAALLAGGGLLLMKGHDIFSHLRGGHGGNGTDIPTPSPTDIPTSGPEIPTPTDIPTPDGGTGHALETIRVNRGDGEIKVTQHILEQLGINVSVEDAQRIGEHANVDLLMKDRNYDDTRSILNRIGGSAGEYKIRPGSAEALVESAKDLGLVA